eukprot:248635_1
MVSDGMGSRPYTSTSLHAVSQYLALSISCFVNGHKVLAIRIECHGCTYIYSAPFNKKMVGTYSSIKWINGCLFHLKYSNNINVHAPCVMDSCIHWTMETQCISAINFARIAIHEKWYDSNKILILYPKISSTMRC